MKILLTGATGYIGKRLLPILLSQGHQVICCVRDKDRFDSSGFDSTQVSVIEVDFLNEDSLEHIPEDIEVAYYLIHSMSSSINDFEHLEKTSAENFRNRLDRTSARQVIFLSGIINEEKLSRHLSSRRAVEQTLAEGHYHLTTLRAGIIVGSGSASFEIIRDLVEKLPLMVAPRWLNTRAQPIAIRNVLQFLAGVLSHPFPITKVLTLGVRRSLHTGKCFCNLPGKEAETGHLGCSGDDPQTVILLALFHYFHFIQTGSKPGKQHEG